MHRGFCISPLYKTRGWKLLDSFRNEYFALIPHWAFHFKSAYGVFVIFGKTLSLLIINDYFPICSSFPRQGRFVSAGGGSRALEREKQPQLHINYNLAKFRIIILWIIHSFILTCSSESSGSELKGPSPLFGKSKKEKPFSTKSAVEQFMYMYR